MRTLRTAALAPLFALCACIGPSNPYDSDAPREVQARARVHGVVTLADAAADARVALSDGSLSESTRTDDDGGYALELAPGNYALLVTADGAADFTRAVVLAPGDDVEIDVALTDNVAPQGASLRVGDGAALLNDAAPPVLIDGEGIVRAQLVVRDVASSTDSEAVLVEGEAPLTVDALALGADGAKIVQATVYDAAGNFATVQASLTLDTTPPTLGMNPVQVASASGFVSSVSTTVSFDVDGAHEVALSITADGTTEAHAFQPFAPDVTVLLPAVECAGPADAGCITVCATFRDEAGNEVETEADHCAAVTLDTTAPSAPLIVEDDGVVATPDTTIHLIDSSADAFAVRIEVLIDPVQPTFETADSTVAADGTLELALALAAPTTTDPALAAETHVVRVRYVDEAGNVSPESVITLVVDNVAPDMPELADPPRAFPDGPFATDADTLSVNFLGSNTADHDKTFSHYRVETTLLPEPFDTTLRDGIVVQLLPESWNTIRVIAVDEAGNESEPDEISVRHDSLPPSTPVLAPIYAEARKGPVQVGFVNPQLGSFDTYTDEDGVVTVEQVAHYEIKDGRGTGYKRVDVDASLLAELRVGRDNEVCVRGVDDAGNVSNEDCVTVAELSYADVTSNIDRARAFDVFGDSFFFTNSDGLWLRDLRTQGDTQVAPGNSAPSSSFRVRDSKPLFASGDPRRVVLTYESQSGGWAVVHVDLTQSPVAVMGAVVDGDAPYVRGNEIVYRRNGRVMYRGDVNVPGLAPDLTRVAAVAPNAYDAEIDLGDASTMCPGTGPRVDAGVVVWCVTNGVGGEIRAVRAVDGAAASVALNSQPVAFVRRGTLLGGSSTTRQQPQIADGLIAWVEEESGARVVYQPFAPNAPISASSQQRTALLVDDLRDLQRGRIVTVQIHAAITSDIAMGDLFSGGLQLLTDDTAPQQSPVLDDTRVFYADASAGDLVRMFDSSSLRWVAAGGELAFQPVTSNAVTAWIGNVGDEVRLIGRALPIDDPAHRAFIIDDPGATGRVAFFGPAKADPTFAIGGRRIAYLVGQNPNGPFSLRVRELNAEGTDVGDAIVVSDSAGPAFAIDPDGDSLVYVDTTQQTHLVTLPAVPSTPLPSTPVTLAGSADIVMIDLDDGMIVAQRGGNASQTDDTSGQGTLVCAYEGATAQLTPGIRGPKVAHLENGAFLLAAAGGANVDAGYCLLTCSAAPVCAFGDASNSRGRDSFLQVTRDGRIAFINNDLGLDQIVVFDVFAKRWSFATLGDAERSGLSVASRRFVWADTSLGSSGVFELELR